MPSGWSSKVQQGKQLVSASKDTSRQAHDRLNPQDPRGRRTELVPTSCLLASTHTPGHVCPNTHTQNTYSFKT